MEMVLQQSKTMRWSSSAGNDGAGAKKEPEQEETATVAGDELRRGPWTVEEDLTLINYIADHGEGRWNALARAAGLKRTGKSCRLRWLNYLRPDVKRGDFTADEQLLILDLHSRWGNRWSKIAAQLPGRTDNEIKNYWRTRVQKHAKRLNCDASSARFKDAMAAFLWAPSPRIAATTSGFITDVVSAAPSPTMTTATSSSGVENNHYYPSPATTSSSSATSTSSFASSSDQYSAAPHEEKAGVHGGDRTVSCGDWWMAQGTDQDFIWSSSTAPVMQQMNAVDHDQFQDLQDLSGWVQGFSDEGISENNLWSLEDIWRMQ